MSCEYIIQNFLLCPLSLNIMFWDSSMLLHVSTVCTFPLVSSTQLYGWNIVCLFIYQLTDIWSLFPFPVFLSFFIWMHCMALWGEGNSTPLQCSCLENPRDGGAWWATVYGITQSWTRMKWLSSSSSTACGILVSWSGVEPVPPTMEAQNPNHWTFLESFQFRAIIHSIQNCYEYLNTSLCVDIYFHFSGVYT